MLDAEHGDDTEDGSTPAQAARNITHGLAQLAALARDPSAARSLATFADVLDTMAQDAGRLAAFLEDEEAEEAAPPEAGDQEAPAPGGEAGAPLLTFDALHHAVELLTHDTETRQWADAREERELAPVIGEAVATVKATMEALGELFGALDDAKSLHYGRGEEAPSIDATGNTTLALIRFLDCFDDMKKRGLAEPSMALARMLATVQEGSRRPRFSGTVAAVPHRTTPAPQAEIMGRAACALDARRRADPTTRLSVHAGAVAAAIQEKARLVFGKAVAPGKIEDWRNRVMAGDGNPKGFKREHQAMEVWRFYEREIVQNPDRGGSYGPEQWLKVAELHEATIRGEGLASTSEDTDREKAPIPIPSRRKAS